MKYSAADKTPGLPYRLEIIARDSGGMHTRYRLKRRDFLKGSAVLGAAAMAGIHAPTIIASDRSIKIGSYGGYFEDSFVNHIYPEFQKATGIKVESVTQPNSHEWLTTMEQATKAGAVPADLSLYETTDMIRGRNIGGLLSALDPTKMPNVQNLENTYVYRITDSGSVLGIGAMAWYISMVVNTERVQPFPQSWTEFWDAKFKDSLGMQSIYKGGLLDITAAAFFDGLDTLASKEGIVSVINKISEIKPNVKVWFEAENIMQNALQNEEVIAGMYYHDVAGIMAADGFPIVSLFPQEGNVVAYGSWCLSTASDKTEEAHEFINFSCDPATQALMSRKIGTAPLVAKSKTDLTDEEFAAVSSEKPPIVPAYESYLNLTDFISDAWSKMLTS